MPPPSDDQTPTPSLLERLAARRVRPARRGWVRIAAAVLLFGLALVAIAAGVAGRMARRDAVALGAQVARVAAQRDADQAGAALFASPTVAAELAALAAHLPQDTKLALAAREPGGRLRIAIDAADPDALRHILRTDPWFAAFRERGQSAGEDGAIRVTLERDS